MVKISPDDILSMQIVSSGVNLHEMSKPVSGKSEKNVTNLSSAEFAQRVVKG